MVPVLQTLPHALGNDTTNLTPSEDVTINHKLPDGSISSFIASFHALKLLSEPLLLGSPFPLLYSTEKSQHAMKNMQSTTPFMLETTLCYALQGLTRSQHRSYLHPVVQDPELCCTTM